MKILILGANGELGRTFFENLSKDGKNKIITTSNSNIRYTSKFHKKINLKNNLIDVLNIIKDESFDVIINCLFIKGKNNEYDTDIPKEIINYINKKNYKNIIWIEISSYSIFLKYKTKYINTKFEFEEFLKHEYKNNLTKLKIIRIGNFLNNHIINKLCFIQTKKFIFVLSNKENVFYLTQNKDIKYFCDNLSINQKNEHNLVKKFSLYHIFNMINDNEKKIIFLNLNEKILFFFRIFLNKKYKIKLFNLLNLFYSK